MKFMVETTMKAAPTPEIQALIPSEMVRGAELDAQGLRKMLYVAADFSKSWQVFDVASEPDVQHALASLPLYPYVHNVVTELSE